MKVEELKNNMKVTGTQKELVAQVFAASENGFNL